MADLVTVQILLEVQALRKEIAQLIWAVQSLRREVAQDTMATQADVDALAARLETADATEQAALQGIKDDIAALRQANPTLDLTDLDAKVAALESDAAAEQQAATDNASPPAP